MSAQHRTYPNSSRSVVASRFVTLLLIALVFTLTGCGPKITVTWASSKSEIHEDTKLRLAGVEVGHVTDVRTEGGQFVVEAQVYRKHAKEVRADSAFFVHAAQDSAPAFVEIVTLRPESPAIADGAILRGSDTETGAGLRTLTSDWRHTALIIGLAVVALVVATVLAKALLKVWALLFCVVAGSAGAYFAPRYVQPYLLRWVPTDFRPDLFAYAVGFLLAYFMALLVVSLIRAPVSAVRD